MKKRSLIATIIIITIMIISGCGQVDRKVGNDSSTIQTVTTMEQRVKEDSSLQIEEISSDVENNSLLDESKEEVSKEKTAEKHRKGSDFSGSTDTSSINSVYNSGAVCLEEITTEIGPVLIDEEPTICEETEREVMGPSLSDKIVFKPSTHYLHRATCHWVTKECYEVTSTNDIEARICTECNPDIEVVNEYKEPEPIVSSSFSWSGAVLNPSAGVVYGPTGKETYYNLDMSGVISIMRGMGFDSTNYPYWVRADGCKMLGNYIMVAAALDVHPRGSLVECSLGTAIVCDTGGFAYGNPYQLDVATTW